MFCYDILDSHTLYQRLDQCEKDKIEQEKTPFMRLSVYLPSNEIHKIELYVECMGVHTKTFPLTTSGTERSGDRTLNRFETYKFVSQTQFECEFSTLSIFFPLRPCVCACDDAMCRYIDGIDFP